MGEPTLSCPCCLLLQGQGVGGVLAGSALLLTMEGAHEPSKLQQWTAESRGAVRAAVRDRGWSQSL